MTLRAYGTAALWFAGAGLFGLLARHSFRKVAKADDDAKPVGLPDEKPVGGHAPNTGIEGQEPDGWGRHP